MIFIQMPNDLDENHYGWMKVYIGELPKDAL